MSIDLFFRLEYVDFLIRSKSTGKPKEFAGKLNVSERSLYDVIQLMKGLGAPIAYCKQKKTYYYTEEGNLILHFQKEKKPANLSSFASIQLGKAVVYCICLFDLFVESDMVLWIM